MKYTICYISKSAEKLDSKGVEDIFAKTVHNNNKSGINGILVYGMGNFLQVLEGEQSLIQPLFEDIIKEDTRHHDIFEVINRPSEQAIFSSYNSTFNVIKTPQELENIKNYLSLHRIYSTADKYRRLLTPFLIEL